MAENLDIFRKDFLNANTWAQRKDGAPLYLLDRKRYWQLTIFFVLVKLCLHLFTYNNYQLHRDEMLYFNQGAHISLGNATVPPFIGWIAFLIKMSFGHSVFAIKLIPALLGVATMAIIGKTVKDLGGGLFALALACLAFLLSPGFLLFDSLFTVNVFDQFFWALAFYLFFRMIHTGDTKIWIPIGVVSGMAFLNKYLILYLLFSMFVVLLFSSHRKLLLSKYFFFACIIGLLIISPNVYWQYAHGWPIFSHISELEKTQMAHMKYGNFLIDLFDLNYVVTFFWLTGLAGVIFMRSEKQYRYLGLVAITVLFLFLISRGKAYYALGVFPMLFALSGFIIEKYLTNRSVCVKYLLLATIAGFSLLAVPFAIPLLSFEKLGQYSKRTAGYVSYPFSRWEDGKTHHISQVFSDMTGWEELVSLVNKAYQQIPENDRINCTVYAERNYGYAGAVHFYGRKYNLPEAITFLESYVLWAPDTIPKGPMIYINYDMNKMNAMFKNVETAGTVNNIYFRENRLKVFLFQHPLDTLQELYREKAIAEKKLYSRR